ncbi:cytosolic 5'-nucleotidase 1A-like [Amphiprion ocellaris]|uniref:cytosolic 5'-nucleotidase 1A-like n=1 Tax=Amphiprion ocellaris TaxID=80972 RepID=UPI002411557C|nr:cytosolic 5'-nucleotidase 1A-like [Amphiprion ocellaris]
MSSYSNPLTSPGQDLKNKACTGKTKGMKSDTGSPVTIAMPSELFFGEEPQSTCPAFHFVMALKAVNAKLEELYPESEELFKVLLIGDSSSDSLNKAIRGHGLEELITVLDVSDEDLISELQRTNTHLYLSTEPGLNKVQEALSQGIAAAIMKSPENIEQTEGQLRVAFDGDAVLFSNESEKLFQCGLQAYLNNEQENVEIPMEEGPFKSFLEVLERLKMKLQEKGLYRNCPIRTYLVTSRGAGSDGYRALNSLRMWGLEVDEAVFLGGTKKGPTLEKIRPHIFFDDQQSHINAALEVGTVACLVPINSD